MYKQYNVSPSDHDALVDVFGQTGTAAESGRRDLIVSAVCQCSRNGMFEVDLLWREQNRKDGGPA